MVGSTTRTPVTAIGNGAVVVEGLAALDPRSGAILDWFPQRTLGVGVYGFSAVDDGLWIGSDTDRINGFEFHGRLAFMPLSGGHSLPAEHIGSLPGQTVTITTTNVITRNVTDTSVTTVGTTGAADWTGLRGAFMISGKLYTGWSDRTFKVQDYDGATFGPRTTIPLQLITPDHPGGPGNPATSINRFSTEDLATITAMFYDQTTGRIYFTKSGQSRLFYRTFSIDTNIVGAHRQRGPGEPHRPRLAQRAGHVPLGEQAVRRRQHRAIDAVELDPDRQDRPIPATSRRRPTPARPSSAPAPS